MDKLQNHAGFGLVTEVVEIKDFEQDTDRFACETRFIRLSDSLRRT